MEQCDRVAALQKPLLKVHHLPPMDPHPRRGQGQPVEGAHTSYTREDHVGPDR